MKKIAVFDVPGDPQGKARPRVFVNKYTGKAHGTTPQKTVIYENWIAQCYLNTCGESKIEGCVEVWIEAYFRIPKSFSKRKRHEALEGTIHPKKKPDIDNIAKAVLDGLIKANAYEDDSYVVDLHCKKRYAEDPHLHIEIEQVVTSNV